MPQMLPAGTTHSKSSKDQHNRHANKTWRKGMENCWCAQTDHLPGEMAHFKSARMAMLAEDWLVDTRTIQSSRPPSAKDGAYSARHHRLLSKR